MKKLPTLTAALALTYFVGLLPTGAAATRPAAVPKIPVIILRGAAKAAARITVATPSLAPAERAHYLAAFEQHVARTYIQAGLLTAALPLPVYRQALLGFYNLQRRGLVGTGCHTVSIADFSQPSSRKRLWVVDVTKGQLLHHTLVAHGKNTGEEYASSFSNVEGSEKSSLGFYVTGPTYQGKHGLSLRLRGVDAGYNTNAAGRAIVVHGADYVSAGFVSQHGRLGRSQGCPALPTAEAPGIIRTIKSGTLLYINGPAQARYQSELLALDAALLAFAEVKGLLPG